MNYFSNASPVAGFELRARDAALGADERSALLAEARANPAAVPKLAIVATTYVQGATPNRNHLRFKDAARARLAGSFKGKPWLRDHAQRDLLARGGTVVASESVDVGAGVWALQQTIELVKPWAIEAALDGTLDRFSIGWRATGDVTCTVCGGAYEQSVWGAVPTCNHQLGQTYDVKGTRVVAQAEFSEAEGIEVSGVSVPAVLGTSVDEIRAALAAGANLEPAAFSAALAAQPAVADDLVRTTFEALRTELAASQERERAARAQLAAREIDWLLEDAVRSGRMIPNSDLSREVRRMAEQSLDAARALIRCAPRLTPVGQPMHSKSPDPTPKSPDLSAEQSHVNALIGVSDDAFARSQSRKEK